MTNILLYGTLVACDTHAMSGMRGERSMRAAASLAVLATLLVLSSAQLSSAELTSDPGGLYGDRCSVNSDCHFSDSVCDELHKICQCHPDVPISNYKDKCGKPATINETCMFNEQCEDVDFKTECKNDRCACKFEMVPELVDGTIICTFPHKAHDNPHSPSTEPTQRKYSHAVYDGVQILLQQNALHHLVQN